MYDFWKCSGDDIIQLCFIICLFCDNDTCYNYRYAGDNLYENMNHHTSDHLPHPTTMEKTVAKENILVFAQACMG
jgi:hypothetical protein